MSIKGFSIYGEVQKYDYNALDNLPNVTGLSEEAKTALLACFENVAWINADGQTYYDALEAALSPATMYSITNNLTGCTTSNSAATIAEGSTYTATITASSGYTLEGATATATMGGQTVTGFYNNGQISIPNVTGDLVITVTASSPVASISAVFTQGANVIYDTYLLSALKQYLVVTATYADTTSETVNDYTLSGTLAVGTSTITASFGGKTDTFDVTVSSRVPAEYKQVEYLQSNGTQGIMIDLVPRDTQTETTFEFVGFPDHDSFITGVYNDNNQRYYSCWVNSDGVVKFHNRSNTVKWTGPTKPTGKHTVIFNNASHQALYDGTVRATDSTFAITSGNNKLAIFCRGRDTTSTYAITASIAKIFSLKFTDNSSGDVVGEFIPCYRKADDVRGMYDLVSQTFYTDSINGDPLTKGADAWETGV